MAKCGIGKLGKLKCMIKRWHSSSSKNKLHQHPASRVSVAPHDDDTPTLREPSPLLDDNNVPLGLHPIYVGASRRRYLISSHLVDHPLFRGLLQRSGSGVVADGEVSSSGTVVGCEVVLFEHLLWMLENGDPQPESLDEFVDFYSY